MQASDSAWIKPNTGNPLPALAMYALVWNGFGWHVAWNTLHDLPAALAQGRYGVLLLFLLPVIGLFLLYWFIHTAVHLRRYGKSRLQLDPMPGAIGGQVGGQIQLSHTLPPDSVVRVTLQCLHSKERRRGRRGRGIDTKIQWQAEMNARKEHTATATTVLHYLFDVPTNLPASSAPGKEWHHWQLRVQAKAPIANLNLDFDIPMRASQQKSRKSMPGLAREQQRERNELLVRLLNPEQKGKALYFELPYGRGRSSALMLGVAAVAFGWMGPVILQEGSGAGASVMGWLFMLAGAAMLAATLYIPFNRLQVAIDPGHVYLRRHWMGLPIARKQLALDDIAAVEAEESSSVSSNNRHVVYFRVVLVTQQRRRLTILEDIPGQDVADEAVRFLLQQTPLRKVAQTAQETPFD